MRHRFAVPADAQRLTVSFRAHRWSSASIESPTGARYEIARTKGRVVFRSPVAGEWKLVVTGGYFANFSRHKVRLALRAN